MEMVVSLQSAWMGVKRRMQLRCNYALVIAAAAPPHCPPEPKPGRGNRQQQQSQKVGSEAHAAKQWCNASGKRKENLLLSLAGQEERRIRSEDGDGKQTIRYIAIRLQEKQRARRNSISNRWDVVVGSHIVDEAGEEQE